MYVICVLCLIVIPLPPGENPFAVKYKLKKINKNKKNVRKRKIVALRQHLKSFRLNLGPQCRTACTGILPSPNS
jgi:hypothetical protein